MKGCRRDEYKEEAVVIDYLLYTDVGLRWMIAPTLLLHCASSGNDSLLLTSFYG
jgi:hypothetical protein